MLALCKGIMQALIVCFFIIKDKEEAPAAASRGKVVCRAFYAIGWRAHLLK